MAAEHPLADLPGSETDASRHISVVHFAPNVDIPPTSTSEPSPSGDDWFTHELKSVSDQRLGEMLLDGTTASRIDSASSGWSELDAEVERLAHALQQLRCQNDITVVDYCRSRTRFTTGLNNSNLGAFMAKERPDWSRVRWICVNGGIDGDVLSLLARAYNLQPLALEDTTTFQRVKVDSYREHLFLTSYVYDLVDRPRSRDKDREHQRRMRRQRQGGCCSCRCPKRGSRGGAGGSNTDVEDARHSKASSGCCGGGCCDGGCCGGGGSRRQRERAARRYLHSAWGTDDSDDDGYQSSSSGFYSPTTDPSDTSSDDSDDDSAGPWGQGPGNGRTARAVPMAAGGRAAAAARRRQLRRTYGRVWADDDPAQVALEGWAGHMRAQRAALTREWAERVASGNLGADASQGGAAGSVRGGVKASPGASAGSSSRKRSQHGPSLQEQPGVGGPAHPAASGAKAAVAAVACHLGAKHRRHVRLRIPLQAPFFSYQTSGRSLGRKKVMLEQASFFVCPGGVVISLFQRTGHQVAAPVLARLRGMQSLLVDSEDAGVLLQALLQASLDHSVPVFEAFASKVASVDAQLVGGKFHVAQSRRLHLLATDLSLMLRSFATLQPMLQSLLARAVLPPPDSEDEEEEGDGGAPAAPTDPPGVPYHHPHGDGGGVAVSGSGARGRGGVGVKLDGARAAAARAVGGVSASGPRAPPSITSSHPRPAPSVGRRGGVGAPHVSSGILLTELAGMYLSDTHDQALTGEQDLAALLEHTNRLNDLVFNSVSHSNESSNMTLAVLSMFFLPITFVSSVFGMNFEILPELHWKLGYLYFWGVCATLLVICSLVLLRLRIVLMPRGLRELPRHILCCLLCGGCRHCRRRRRVTRG